MARRLRIAAAVFFAVLAIGFVALWVRSYYWEDYVAIRAGDGQISLDSHGGSTLGTYEAGWFLRRAPAYGIEAIEIPVHNAQPWGVRLFTFSMANHHAPHLMCPHWFLAACSLATTGALAFRFPRRFSVRGLLIATTLLSAILGLAVYAT